MSEITKTAYVGKKVLETKIIDILEPYMFEEDSPANRESALQDLQTYSRENSLGLGISLETLRARPTFRVFSPLDRVVFVAAISCRSL